MSCSFTSNVILYQVHYKATTNILNNGKHLQYFDQIFIFRFTAVVVPRYLFKSILFLHSNVLSIKITIGFQRLASMF